MRDDPCFSCPLDDCDDRSPRCVIRRLSNAYDAKVRRGEKHLITEQEREANNSIFHIWKLDRDVQAAEGVRPYKRWERETAARRRREQAASP